MRSRNRVIMKFITAVSSLRSEELSVGFDGLLIQNLMGFASKDVVVCALAFDILILQLVNDFEKCVLCRKG